MIFWGLYLNQHKRETIFDKKMERASLYFNRKALFRKTIFIFLVFDTIDVSINVDSLALVQNL